MNNNSDNNEDIEITIKMNRESAGVLMRACEFYSRVLCGQFGEINRAITDNKIHKIYEEEGKEAMHEEFNRIIQERDNAETSLIAARKMSFPELHPQAHYGFGYSRETDMSFDLYTSVRYALAWHDHPEGGNTVNFSKPLTNYKLPEVTITDTNNKNTHQDREQADYEYFKLMEQDDDDYLYGRK